MKRFFTIIFISFIIYSPIYAQFDYRYTEYSKLNRGIDSIQYFFNQVNNTAFTDQKDFDYRLDSIVYESLDNKRNKDINKFVFDYSFEDRTITTFLYNKNKLESHKIDIYDELGRLISSSSYKDDKFLNKYEISYYDDGSVKEYTSFYLMREDIKKVVSFDQEGKRTKETDYMISDNKASSVSYEEYGYDDKNRLNRSVKYYLFEEINECAFDSIAFTKIDDNSYERTYYKVNWDSLENPSIAEYQIVKYSSDKITEIQRYKNKYTDDKSKKELYISKCIYEYNTNGSLKSKEYNSIERKIDILSSDYLEGKFQYDTKGLKKGEVEEPYFRNFSKVYDDSGDFYSLKSNFGAIGGAEAYLIHNVKTANDIASNRILLPWTKDEPRYYSKHMILSEDVETTMSGCQDSYSYNSQGKYYYSPDYAATDNIKNSTFNIFPNPTSNKLYIQLNTKLDQNATISLYNLKGQIVLSKQINEDAFIYTHNLQKGVYILKINQNNITNSQKVIVK
ncbi:MAG: T9SS type A sorting domain-containing protein [Hyphomicrobiales bacterium]